MAGFDGIANAAESRRGSARHRREKISVLAGSEKSVGRLSPLREERRPSRPITRSTFGTDPKTRCRETDYFRFAFLFFAFFLALRLAILHSPLLIGYKRPRCDCFAVPMASIPSRATIFNWKEQCARPANAHAKPCGDAASRTSKRNLRAHPRVAPCARARAAMHKTFIQKGVCATWRGIRAVVPDCAAILRRKARRKPRIALADRRAPLRRARCFLRFGAAQERQFG